jgi:hypothetical protein
MDQAKLSVHLITIPLENVHAVRLDLRVPRKAVRRQRRPRPSTGAINNMIAQDNSPEALKIVLRTSISACSVKLSGGSVVSGTSTGSASPGHTHTKPSFSATGRCATSMPLHCTVLGILVHWPPRSNVQPWYGHCTCK